MKTFVKILIGFVIGAISMFVFISGVFGYLEAKCDNEKLDGAKEHVANYVRRLGYEVKKPEKAEFKFGFH